MMKYQNNRPEKDVEDYILGITREQLAMLMPPQSPNTNGIAIKANQVLQMLRYEILIRDYRSIILFLTSGNSDKIKDILNGFILYFLWREIDQFIALQVNPTRVLQPIFPQVDFNSPFLSNAGARPPQGQGPPGPPGPGFQSRPPGPPPPNASMSLRDRMHGPGPGPRPQF